LNSDNRVVIEHISSIERVAIAFLFKKNTQPHWAPPNSYVDGKAPHQDVLNANGPALRGHSPGYLEAKLPY
jgi:hypothetical protein